MTRRKTCVIAIVVIVGLVGTLVAIQHGTAPPVGSTAVPPELAEAVGRSGSAWDDLVAEKPVPAEAGYGPADWDALESRFTAAVVDLRQVDTEADARSAARAAAGAFGSYLDGDSGGYVSFLRERDLCVPERLEGTRGEKYMEGAGRSLKGALVDLEGVTTFVVAEGGRVVRNVTTPAMAGGRMKVEQRGKHDVDPEAASLVIGVRVPAIMRDGTDAVPFHGDFVLLLARRDSDGEWVDVGYKFDRNERTEAGRPQLPLLPPM